ncbi:MAG: HDOD domain-containing protein, partial [Gammaproteobacteria bacterium]|nr:HDOD domain-containing protein [Gammaproteobacteria bacterium]
LGLDPNLGRKVALKLLTPVDADTTWSQDVIDEARIAARISHPNVIPIFEVDQYRFIPFLVFEYVDGMTLKEHLREHGRLDEKAALRLMAGIADGLRCAHEQGIVHLDLSPNNIMIDTQQRPRIMDFGLARVIANIDKDDYQKKLAGTPRYMSPEHLSGEALVPASDIFSLGALFYEMLTGIPAFNQKDVNVILSAIEHAEVDWSNLQRMNVMPETIALVRDMLQVNPDHRIQSAIELVPAIKEVTAMQTSSDQASLSLEFLLRRLQRRPEFPACSHSIAEINKLTAEDTKTSFSKLGSIIARDYSLTNRVMKIANSVIFDRRGDGVKTISQAITRLGLRQLRMICNGVLLFKQGGDQHQELKDFLIASFVAGLIARHVTAVKDQQLAEEAFICALFHNLGNHLLIFYLPDEYEDIQSMIDNGMLPQKAERAVLSTTTAALGMAVAGKWNFPETIINCMNRLPEGIIDAAVNAEGTLLHAANFANEFCQLTRSHGEGTALLMEINTFLERHQTLYQADVTLLGKLSDAASQKFRELAPGLGINFEESPFCCRLAEFSASIEAALNTNDQVANAV